jgi:hypothetical protein
MQVMSENLQFPLLTAEQTRTVLVQFSEILSVFARQLPDDSERLVELLKDAATSIRELAADIAESDRAIAHEIVISTARLVGVVRKVVSVRQAASTMH